MATSNARCQVIDDHRGVGHIHCDDLRGRDPPDMVFKVCDGTEVRQRDRRFRPGTVRDGSHQFHSVNDTRGKPLVQPRDSPAGAQQDGVLHVVAGENKARHPQRKEPVGEKHQHIKHRDEAEDERARNRLVFEGDQEKQDDEQNGHGLPEADPAVLHEL